jgi:predicted nucleic acid-binding protein
MNVVVDSPTIISVLVDGGPHGGWAEQLVANHVLYAPQLLLVEKTKVFRRLERSHHLATAETNAALEDRMQLAIELLPLEPFVERIWDLRQALTSYDAWYVAVAEALHFPLATLDEHLANTTGPKCQFLLTQSS